MPPTLKSFQWSDSHPVDSYMHSPHFEDAYFLEEELGNASTPSLENLLRSCNSDLKPERYKANVIRLTSHCFTHLEDIDSHTIQQYHL